MSGIWRAVVDDWRMLALLYMVGAGVWGFLVKLVADRVDWWTTAGLFLSANFVVVALVCLPRMAWEWGRPQALAVAGGVIAGLASLAFYRAAGMAEATRLIPLASQSIVITVVLAAVFLREPVTLRTLAGVACAVGAVILLGGK